MTRVCTAPWLDGLLAAGLSLPALADSSATMHAVSADGVGDSIGAISFQDSDHGLLIHPQLQGMAAGLHGLHVHQNADCGPGTNDKGETIAAGAAGGHMDPQGTGSHEGPYGDGHLGDLPNLVVLDDGTAGLVLLAPRLTVADLDGRAIMIHSGADDCTDSHPGGDRAYCGIVE
ncbi:MAG: superoxide dismutase family protein [Proteobacteria bacterium]|nr:superoxide dismutase family protein [Pseudomonadota bacterium]MDA1071961.1 superoxide dismutase family protein [Pseudomonadota bacterium]